jgi:hypothetical protein
MASTASDPSTALGASLESLALLETLTDDVDLLGASLNQDLDSAGDTFDVVDVYFRLPGRPGMLTVRVPFDSNWTAQAFYALGVKQALVNGIYDGLASKADLPRGPVGAPVPQPGTPF